MKYAALLIAFLLSFNAMSENQPILNNLEPLIWKNRVIIFFTNDTEQYQTRLQQTKAAIDDRDIAWFIIDGNETKTNYQGGVTDAFATTISRQYSALDAAVILIGKDGGVKETGDLLSLNGLFDEIDSMPMRIREMKNKSSSQSD